MKHLGRLAMTGLVVLFIATLTLQSAERIPGREASPFLCMIGCGNQGTRDLLSNILLFVPLGWVARYWTTHRTAILICLVSTIGIEASQAFLLVGRDPSLRDIVTNVAGGILGSWLYVNWNRLVRPGRPAAVRLGGGALFVWVGVLWATGIALRPSPTSAAWYGQWAAELGQYDRYIGVVREVRVGGWTPPSARMNEPQPIRAGFEHDSLVLTVVVISGERPRRPAPIFSVFDDRQQEQFFVGQKRGDLVLGIRTHFDQWNFRGLSLRLPYFPGRNPGDTVTVRSEIRPSQWLLAAQSGATTDSVSLPLTLGLGWPAMLPFGYTIYNEWLVLNGIWMAVLLAPAAYWLGRSGSRGAQLSGAGVVLVTLLVLPRMLGLTQTLATEWYGSAASVGLGLVLAVRSWWPHRRPV